MKDKHIAFCLEQAYGHIMPTLGITSELLKRGHLVSYAVTEHFASLIRKAGARPLVIDPLDTREEWYAAVTTENDHLNYRVNEADLKRVAEALSSKRTAGSLAQLERLFADEPPDVIIHDDCLDTAGRSLAVKWGIPKIRHQSQFLDETLVTDIADYYSDDDIVLMTVPEFFQPNRLLLDQRFKFVGFIPEGRKDVFEPWTPPGSATRPILISATTGMSRPIAFCNLMIDAFRQQPWDTVLSISGSHDAISALDPAGFANLPGNVRLNLRSANLEVLESASLFIGQGGQGSTLEAIFAGVPQLVIPPTPHHHSVARRVVELGLGYCIAPSELSAETLLTHVEAILKDTEVLRRVKSASTSMQNARGAQRAAEVIEARVGCGR